MSELAMERCQPEVSSEEHTMTDRHSAYIVILEQDIRDDDAQATINAIKQIRGVLGVEPHIASPIDEQIAAMRARNEIANKIFQAIWPEKA